MQVQKQYLRLQQVNQFNQQIPFIGLFVIFVWILSFFLGKMVHSKKHAKTLQLNSYEKMDTKSYYNANVSNSNVSV